MSATAIGAKAPTQAERVAAIAAHPKMPEAMRLLASGLIDFFQGGIAGAQAELTAGIPPVENIA